MATGDGLIEQPQQIAATERGIQLRSIDEMWRFAECVHQSGLAPTGLKSPQACLVAIQMGAECGLAPMASLQNIAVINGRPSLWGDGMLAVCRGSGQFCEETFEEGWEGEGDELHAFCVVRRTPNGKPCRRTFSVQQAKQAGLWGKQGPWKQYPERMLQMRARSFALRDMFGDALRGMHSAEEMVGVAASQPANGQQALSERLLPRIAQQATPQDVSADSPPSASQTPPIETPPAPVAPVAAASKESAGSAGDAMEGQDAGDAHEATTDPMEIAEIIDAVTSPEELEGVKELVHRCGANKKQMEDLVGKMSAKMNELMPVA